MPQLNSRLLPFALFLAVTSTVIGVAVGFTHGGLAVGIGAGVLACVLLAASTSLLTLLAQGRDESRIEQLGSWFLALNLAALTISVVLMIATRGPAQEIGVAGAIVAVVALLGLREAARRT